MFEILGIGENFLITWYACAVKCFSCEGQWRIEPDFPQ